MQLNLKFDANVPSDFAAGLQPIVQEFDTLITNPITVTLGVGFGTVNNIPMMPGAAGESQEALGTDLTPTQLLAALQANPNPVTQKEVNGLLSSNALAQIPNVGLFTSQAQLKALGLASPNTTETDGYIGFGSPYSWALGGTAPNGGQLSQEMVAEHEITEAMGRVETGLMSFLQWTAPGQISALGIHQSHYLSLDGGQTNLADMSTVGDLSDLAGTGDPLEYVTPFGAQFPFSAVDKEFMAGLGFGIEGVTNPTPTPPPPSQHCHEHHHHHGHGHYCCEWEKQENGKVYHDV